MHVSKSKSIAQCRYQGTECIHKNTPTCTHPHVHAYKYTPTSTHFLQHPPLQWSHT